MTLDDEEFHDFFQNPSAIPVVTSNGGDHSPSIIAVDPTAGANAVQQQPNAVLRVIIENMLYPVTLDVLHTVSLNRFSYVLSSTVHYVHRVLEKHGTVCRELSN